VITRSGAQLALIAEDAPDLPQIVMQTVEIGPGNDPGAPSVAIRPDNAAYLLFTSGSTGPPKGVLVEHRNVVSYLRACTGSARRPRATSASSRRRSIPR